MKKNLEVAKGRRERQSEAKKKDERLAALRAQRDALANQVAATRSAIDNLHTQTQRTHADIAAVERNNAELHRKLEEHDVKAIILENYERSTARLHSILNEFLLRLSAKLSQLQSTKNVSSSNQSTQTASPDQPSAQEGLQSGIDHTGELCAAIAAHLAEQLSTNSINAADDVLAGTSTLPSDITAQLGQTCSSAASVSALLSSLSAALKHDVELLEASTDNLDTSALEDAVVAKLEQDLLRPSSLTTSQGSSSSLLSSTSSLSSSQSSNSATSPRAEARTRTPTSAKWPTVEELLEKQRQEHVLRYVETEKHLNTAYSLQQQRDQMLASAARGKMAKLDGENDPTILNSSLTGSGSTISKAEAQKLVQDLELTLCGDEAAYEASCMIVERLQAAKAKYESDLRTLKDKFQRIQALEDENRERQTICQELLRLNGGATEKLEAQASALRVFMSAKIVDQQREDNPVQVGSLMEKEIATFQQLPLLTTCKPEKEITTTLLQLAETLELKAHQSMDDLVSVIAEAMLELQRATEEARQRREEVDKAKRTLTANFSGESALRALDTQAAQVEQLQTNTWLPILEATIAQVSKATEHCSAIQQLCQDFASQPAQHFAPWLSLDGKSYDDTLKSWRSLVHTLRQTSKR